MKNLIVTTQKELKELTGFLDKNFDYSNIKPYVIDASKDLIKLIGKPLYDKAFSIYETTTATDTEKEFLALIQRPIALSAYNKYAPTNDLSHSNDGRRMRNDDKQKQAFEWQLDRSDENQQRLYYRALDYLIDFLDNLNLYTSPTDDEQISEDAIANLWINSDAIKKEKSTFLNSIEKFEEEYPIDSRLVFYKIKPLIKQAEQTEILPRIGATKYQELKTFVEQNKTPTEAQDIELLTYIRRASAAYSLSKAIMRFQVTVFSQGTLQYTKSDRASTQAKKPTIGNEPAAASDAYYADFKLYCTKIEDLLKPLPAITDTNVNPKIIYGKNFISD